MGAAETVRNTPTDPSIENALSRWIRNIWGKNPPPSENLNDVQIGNVSSIANAEPGSSGSQNESDHVYSRSGINRVDGDDDDFDTEPLIESQP